MVSTPSPEVRKPAAGRGAPGSGGSRVGGLPGWGQEGDPCPLRGERRLGAVNGPAGLGARERGGDSSPHPAGWGLSVLLLTLAGRRAGSQGPQLGSLPTAWRDRADGSLALAGHGWPLSEAGGSAGRLGVGEMLASQRH